MRSIALIAGLAALAVASPMPQLFDPADLSELEPPPVSDVPIGGGSEIIPYDSSAVVADAYADTIADPSPDLDASLPADLSKRSVLRISKRTPGDCAPQTPGSGPTVPDVADDPASFQNSAVLSGKANGAVTPIGWVRSFLDKKAATSAAGYKGYKTYKSYDVQTVSQDCLKISGCKSFNIYFERDPLKDVGPGCEDVGSTTNIKASFWGVPINENTLTNKGQTRGKSFQVVIAGSNGYNIDSYHKDLDGYNSEFLGDCTINAPATSCAAYLTVKYWNDGIYEPARCKAACEAVSAESPDTPCKFFTSYIQTKNGAYQQQQCALYKRAFDKSTYCTNTGQYDLQNNKIGIMWASSYTDKTDDGIAACSVTSKLA